MEHPFLASSSLNDLTLDELQTKIGDLTGKLQWASRMGNAQLTGQLRMVLESYRTAYLRKSDEMFKKQNMGNIIDIK